MPFSTVMITNRVAHGKNIAIPCGAGQHNILFDVVIAIQNHQMSIHQKAVGAIGQYCVGIGLGIAVQLRQIQHLASLI